MENCLPKFMGGTFANLFACDGGEMVPGRLLEGTKLFNGSFGASRWSEDRERRHPAGLGHDRMAAFLLRYMLVVFNIGF